MIRFIHVLNQSEILRFFASFFVRSEPAMMRIPVLVETNERSDFLLGRRF